MRILWWKWRKYPIKRDEDGRSLRQQAFALFNKKLRPSEIYKQQLVQASQKTLFRYYEDWKKEHNQISYRVIRKIFKNNPDITEKLIETLSHKLEMPVEEVRRRIGEPWGLKRALRNEWPDYRLEREQSEIEDRLEGALAMICLMELFQNSPEQLADLLVQITTLTDGAKLEITREERKLIVKKEAKGKSTTIELDYLNQ
jgi:hypothetical protein